MDIGVENGDVQGGHFYRNSPTWSESNNHNSIYSTKQIYEIPPNIYVMENHGLQDGVGIDFMLPISTLNQYVNMEYNN